MIKNLNKEKLSSCDFSHVMSIPLFRFKHVRREGSVFVCCPTVRFLYQIFLHVYLSKLLTTNCYATVSSIGVS